MEAKKVPRAAPEWHLVKWYWMALFIVPLVLFSLASCGFSVAYLQTLLRVNAHKEHSESGPVRFRGHVVDSVAKVTSPSGARGAGWIAWTGREATDADGNSFHEVVCARAGLHNVGVRGELEQDRNLVVDFPDVVEPNFGDHLVVAQGSRAPRVALGKHAHATADAGEGVPESMRTACAPVVSGRLFYTEDVLAPGAEITVFGCRNGNRLVPCGDEFDAVATVGVVSGTLSEVAWGQFINLIIIGLIGFFTIDAAMRLPRGRAT